jgi:hypothetical protein
MKMDGSSCSASLVDYRTYKEAIHSKHAPRWREAMDLELANLAKYGVFELVPWPKDFRPVPSK